MQCTWVLCCGVRCCMLRCTAHSHCNPYTPIHQTSHTTVNGATSTRHNNEFPNPWGPGRIPGHAQGIMEDLLGALLNSRLYSQPVYPTLKISRCYLLVAQEEHTRGLAHQHDSNNNIRVTCVRSSTASITPKLHQPAPLHEPTHHAQDHNPTISQDTT